MKKAIILFAALSLSFSAFAQKMIPEQTVTADRGKNRQLSEYVAKDGYTLFVFWRLCCSNSKTMLSELSDVWSEYNGKTPIKVVLVSINDVRDASRVKAYIGSCDYGWEMIMDLNMELCRAMNIIAPPQWVAVDNTGKIIMEHKIMSGANDPAIYFKELQNIKQ